MPAPARPLAKSPFLAALGIVVCVAAGSLLPSAARAATAEERLEMYRRYLEFPSLVRGGTVEPHWMEAQGGGDAFWFVDESQERKPAFRVDPDAGTVERLPETPAPPDGAGEDGPRIVRESLFPGFPPIREVPSPDGSRFLTERGHDLWLRPAGSDGETGLVRLTRDGAPDFDWRIAQDDLWSKALWSPDGRRVAALKEDRDGVAHSPLVHWLEPSATVEWMPLTKAGGQLARTELWVIEVGSRERVRIDTPPGDWYLVLPGWTADGAELLVLAARRDFRVLRLLAADPESGATRLLHEETSPTFIKNLSLDPEWPGLVTLLPETGRFLWISERDGWGHLYLHDLETGRLLRRLTAGSFPVLGVTAVDEERGRVYFTAHAEAGRPYDTHLYRVGLDGSGFRRLTDEPGQHDVAFTPSKAYFLDTHSSLDRRPRTDLRRADGTRVRTLSRADVSGLEALRFRPPEPFVVTAADGETELHGVLYTPWDLDPERDPERDPDGDPDREPVRKLPVIEHIYAGPFRTYNQRRFTTGSPWRGTFPQALAQLGYAVFTVDGRGTPERGKAFQDVIHRRFGQVEVDEHVAVLRQLAVTHPFMDLSRVGIFGGSWGGYMTVRALLTAPDVYRVGVAASPVYDFYDHGATGLEGYLGLLEDNPEGYEAGSNLKLVENLRGKLLLMHGTLDANATFSATMKMVDALTRAGKPYDLIVLPDQRHHFEDHAWDYRLEAHRRYFQEHLPP